MAARLPIDACLDEVVEAVETHGAAVVVAPPGTGKTTRVPPALTGRGKVILLQPRRVAARALARHIAAERGWALGQEVGWQVRLERRFTAETRLLVATEGILTARLQSDPLLSDFRTVVLDEFHERSLHADLALSLVRQAAAARGDLGVVVMSATLDARPVAEFLGGCPVIEIGARHFPVDVGYAPGVAPAEAVRQALGETDGHTLCFLPGAPEIARVTSELGGTIDGSAARILPLHGSLDSEAQDAALAPSDRRKLILATNLAETSLTVEGVTLVVDSGLHKVLRRDPALGIDRLETERISIDSAEQRSGRAGRTGPGKAIRLWDARDRLRDHREPEILRVDLAGPLLAIFAWGGDPATFDWFQPPSDDAIGPAVELLERLGAIASGKICDEGRRLARLPLHPRLARVLLRAGGTPEAAAACAIISERWRPTGTPETTDSDVAARVDRLAQAPRHVRRVAAELERLGRTHRGGTETSLRRALLAGYPDRLARRREPGSPRLLLASGHGGVLTRDSGVRQSEFLLALDVVAGSRGPGSEARVRMASGLEPHWLEPTRTEVVHELERRSGAVRAFERRFDGAVLVGERGLAPDPDTACELLLDEILRRGQGESDAALVRRLEFAGLPFDLRELMLPACIGRTSLPDIDLKRLLPYELSEPLGRLAPETILLPSGRRARLDYRDDRTVVAAVKLQELFGLADTPTVGPREIPVTLSLLAPNGRPVQTTRDLRSFWNGAYVEVRKELRGRYPKHPWPEDPWTATPTARTKRRR